MTREEVKPLATLIKRYARHRTIAESHPLTGVWTCGWEAMGKGIHSNTKMSRIACEERLERDILEAIGLAKRVHPSLSLPQHHYKVLAIASVILSIGAQRFGPTEFRRLVSEGKFSEAADALRDWKFSHLDEHGLLPTLKERRQAEHRLFCRGRYEQGKRIWNYVGE
jgi:GH24 family phage-related lysozyme (muramidase)